MADAHNYLVPEYYSGFSCKGGSCRSTCCHGWGISFSMKEYFRLLGLTCPPDLRRKLDCAFHLVDDPTEERYAQITPNWIGDCPLHMENGLCQLQAECGEEALTAVCRYYPRGMHTAFRRECSCANSCERVLEMLFDMEEPMRFEERQLSFEMAEGERDSEDIGVRYYAQVRGTIIGALQNRAYRLNERLGMIGGMLRLLNEAFRDKEGWVISGALEVCAEMSPPPAEDRDDLFILKTMYRMLRMFSRSASVEEYIAAAMKRLELSLDDEPDEKAFAKAARIYRAAADEFDRKFPDWQRMFEQMMVNHVFFECFPFSDRHETLWEAYISLCAAYAFVRFMAIMGTEKTQGIEALIDVCAASFRLIEHSAFDRNTAVLLEREGISGAGDMAHLTLV